MDEHLELGKYATSDWVRAFPRPFVPPGIVEIDRAGCPSDETRPMEVNVDW
jgi:hypothetical protein